MQTGMRQTVSAAARSIGGQLGRRLADSAGALITGTCLLAVSRDGPARRGSGCSGKPLDKGVAKNPS